MSHRILVVEDHPLLRHGLKALLGSHPDYLVVDEATDGRDAVAKAFHLQPDLIVMDLSLPGTSGIDATVQIRRRLPQQRVLALSDDDSEIHIGEAMRAGCIGCVKKDCAPEEMMLAAKNVLAGRNERSLYKIVVDEGTDRIVGIHMIGPDAPEILQAAAVAVKAKLKKSDFDQTIALHPTMAEELVLMR